MILLPDSGGSVSKSNRGSGRGSGSGGGRSEGGSGAPALEAGSEQRHSSGLR